MNPLLSSKRTVVSRWNADLLQKNDRPQEKVTT